YPDDCCPHVPTSTNAFYTASLHDALPISVLPGAPGPERIPAAPPLAVRVKSDSRAVPPLSLTTILSSISDGGLSLLVIRQIPLSPRPSVIDVSATNAPPFFEHV